MEVSMKKYQIMATVLVFLNLAGCAKSPPSCDSGEVETLIKEILLDEIKDDAVKTSVLKALFVKDDDPLKQALLAIPEMSLGAGTPSYNDLQKYKDDQLIGSLLGEIDENAKSLDLELEGIRTESKDAEVKKSICLASVNTKVDGESKGLNDIRYLAQLTEKGEIYVEVSSR